MSEGAIDWESLLTTKVQQYRHGLLALVDQGLVSLTNFATALLIGRMCGKPELGIYTLAWTLLSIATELSGALITTPYTVFGPQLSRYRRSRYLGSIFVHQLILGVVFAVFIAAGAILCLVCGWASRSAANVFTITAGAVVFVAVKEFVRRVCFAELRLGSAFLIDVMACIGQVGGVLLLLEQRKLAASGAFMVLGVSSAAAAGLWLLLRKGTFRFESLLYERDLRRNWSFAKWVLASGVLSAVARYLYPWMLAAFHGTSVTGAWAACAAIVAMCNPAVLGVSNYALPKISNVYARSGSSAMQRSVNRFSLLFIFLLLPVVLALGVFGERIVTCVYGSAYAGSAAILFLLGLNLLINSLTNPYSQGLFNLDCAKDDTHINLLWVVLLFTLGIAIVSHYAALGAAVALVASSSIAAGIRIVVFARRANSAPVRASNLASEVRFGNSKSEELALASLTQQKKMARS